MVHKKEITKYVPDIWVILKIVYESPDAYYKILAGWYGGFAKGNEWKLNSGITKITEKDDSYIIEGYSGSQYICRKNSEKYGIMLHTVFESFKKQLPKFEVSIIDINSIKDKLK